MPALGAARSTRHAWWLLDAHAAPCREAVVVASRPCLYVMALDSAALNRAHHDEIRCLRPALAANHEVEREIEVWACCDKSLVAAGRAEARALNPILLPTSLLAERLPCRRRNYVLHF